MAPASDHPLNPRAVSVTRHTQAVLGSTPCSQQLRKDARRALGGTPSPSHREAQPTQNSLPSGSCSRSRWSRFLPALVSGTCWNQIGGRSPAGSNSRSMAAALCSGARGGGAQLCFDVTAGNYDTDRLIEVLKQLRRFLGGREGHPAVGRAAVAPQHRDPQLDPHPAVLAGGRAAPAYAPELNPVEGLWSNLKAVELAPPGHRAGAPHAASRLLVPAPDRPVGLMTSQPDTQDPLGR